MSIVSQIARYLDAEGLVTFDETGATGDTFIGVLPDKPDIAIALYATGGPPGDVKIGYELPTVQVLVRSAQDPRPGEAKAQAIYDKLRTVSGAYLVPGGDFVVSCLSEQSGPAHIGRDEKNRHEYSLNFRLDIMRG